MISNSYFSVMHFLQLALVQELVMVICLISWIKGYDSRVPSSDYSDLVSSQQPHSLLLKPLSPQTIFIPRLVPLANHDHSKEIKMGQRYIAAHHKTGSVLGWCLSKVLSEAGFHTHHFTWHTWTGFNSEAYQLQFARNPFILIDSAYSYHKRYAEPGWTQKEKLSSGHSHNYHEGHFAAYQSWSIWQPQKDDIEPYFGQKTTILPSDSYGDALNRLSVPEGLLLESIRALYRDIPYMLSTAESCSLARQNATSPSSPTGRCETVFLDDVMTDFENSFDKFLAHPLNVREEDVGKKDHETMQLNFLHRCSVNASAESIEHSSLAQENSIDKSNTVTGSSATANDSNDNDHYRGDYTSRDKRMALIRILDEKYLGGIIADAEKKLLPYRFVPEY